MSDGYWTALAIFAALGMGLFPLLLFHYFTVHLSLLLYALFNLYSLFSTMHHFNRISSTLSFIIHFFRLKSTISDIIVQTFLFTWLKLVRPVIIPDFEQSVFGVFDNRQWPCVMLILLFAVLIVVVALLLSIVSLDRSWLLCFCCHWIVLLLMGVNIIRL